MKRYGNAKPWGKFNKTIKILYIWNCLNDLYVKSS